MEDAPDVQQVLDGDGLVESIPFHHRGDARVALRASLVDVHRGGVPDEAGESERDEGDSDEDGNKKDQTSDDVVPQFHGVENKRGRGPIRPFPFSIPSQTCSGRSSSSRSPRTSSGCRSTPGPRSGTRSGSSPGSSRCTGRRSTARLGSSSGSPVATSGSGPSTGSR